MHGIRGALFAVLGGAMAAGCGPDDIGARLSEGTALAGDTDRGAVEVYVKSNYPALVSQIRAGQGPELTRALDLAGVPAAEREVAILRLQSDAALHASNPGALVLAFQGLG